jgi:hypothetical protein
MTRDRLGFVGVGLGLIGLGSALLLALWIGWDRIWPIFPILGGLAFFAAYIATGCKEGGLALVGTAAILVGLFFFGFTLGPWQWEQMAQLWPVFPLIGGLAFVVLFWAEGRGRDVGVLALGCAAIVVGLVGLAITFGVLPSDIIKLWPLLIILVGLIGLIGALVQGLRRE